MANKKNNSLRIMSANLNGIRSAARKGFFEWLATKDVDIYLTGDVNYHHALDAKNLGLNVLDIGHHVESLYKGNIKEVLKDNGITCNLIVSKKDTNPYILK